MIVTHLTNLKNDSSGQTLVEVMVALFVLVAGFLGILSLLSQSLALSKTVNNETIATYLASEGIEIARNLVDHDMYQHLAGLGTGWGTCFGLSGGDYELDYTTTNCPPPFYSPSDFLEFDPATNMYGYNGGSPTPFTRLIRVTPDSANELTVDSIVSWSTGPFTSQNVTLEDVFYNWHP